MRPLKHTLSGSAGQRAGEGVELLTGLLAQLFRPLLAVASLVGVDDRIAARLARLREAQLDR